MCNYILNAKKTGIKIHNELIRQNIPVKQIAYNLQISLNAVYKWLNGTSTPDIIHLYQLSQILNVPIENLIAVDTS